MRKIYSSFEMCSHFWNKSKTTASLKMYTKKDRPAPWFGSFVKETHTHVQKGSKGRKRSTYRMTHKVSTTTSLILKVIMTLTCTSKTELVPPNFCTML